MIEESRKRKARIVATIGPATSSREKLRQLMEAGMDVARLNFSHGTHDTYARIIADIRGLSQELERPIAIMQDLQGVKIRTGPLQGSGPVELEAGSRFTITTEAIDGDASRVSTSYSSLPGDVEPGSTILLSDGHLELKVLSTSKTEVECEVVLGGPLAENQGINIPDATISAPSLTGKDMDDVRFGAEHGVDYVALSFVRRPEDVLTLREVMGLNQTAEIPVIAKLEKPAAIESLDGILEVCDGVMVARGDLGVELPPERVPIIQKQVISAANSQGKLVITATQMMESMITNARPTRAEASDVANAVFDGTDAVMLSGETAIGEYPLVSVRMMSRIIREAEKQGASSSYRSRNDQPSSFPEAVCECAYYASKAIRARAIVAFTQSGSTARMISKYRPPVEILAFTPFEHVARRMSFYWGVTPLLMGEIMHIDELITALEQLLRERRLANPGDNLIILSGAPIMERGHTSLMKLHTVKPSE